MAKGAIGKNIELKEAIGTQSHWESYRTIGNHRESKGAIGKTGSHREPKGAKWSHSEP